MSLYSRKAYKFDEFDNQPVRLGCGEQFKEAGYGHQEEARVEPRDLMNRGDCADLDTGLGVLKSV